MDLSLLESRNEVRSSTNHDVSLVRIEECNPTNSMLVTLLPGITFLTEASGLILIPHPERTRKLAEVSVGADIYLFGYPRSIGLAPMPQLDLTRPLMRKGIIAGINGGRRTIILDCPSYPGNSGGPVVIREGPQPHGSSLVFNFYLIGVVAEFVPFEETWQNRPFGYENHTISNSGYSVVEPIDFVIELVWK
jgi:hypothetical protein